MALCASLVAVLIDLLAFAEQGRYTTTPRLGLAFAGYQVLGVGLAVLAWRHHHLDQRSRRAWGIIAVAYALLSVSGALRPYYPAGTDFPSPADLLRLAFAPVMLAGLLTLPLRTHGRRERHKVWLDTVVVVVASAMLLWYLGVGQHLEQAGGVSAAALAAAIAYPVLDLMLIFGVSVVLCRGAAESARRPAAILGLAMLIIVAGDIYLSHRASHLGGTFPDRWQFACWITGHFTLTMAAFAQCRLASRHRVHLDDPGARPPSILPYLAVGLSYLLLGLAVRGPQIRLVGLAIGATVITGVVAVRQVIAVRQHHELATTDPLTGLANRRELYNRLELALTRGSRNGQSVAVLLIHINGFHHLNDTIGHDAGDQLLVAIGQLLRRSVLGGDFVGRLGGNEFAVVVHDISSPENAVAVARRIIVEMRGPVLIGDTPAQPRAAIGVAVSGPGQLTAEELLDDANLAMGWARRRATPSFAMYDEYAAHTGGADCETWATLEPNAPYKGRTGPY